MSLLACPLSESALPRACDTAVCHLLIWPTQAGLKTVHAHGGSCPRLAWTVQMPHISVTPGGLVRIACLVKSECMCEVHMIHQQGRRNRTVVNWLLDPMSTHLSPAIQLAISTRRWGEAADLHPACGKQQAVVPQLALTVCCCSWRVQMFCGLWHLTVAICVSASALPFGHSSHDGLLFA
jgi:hypothetical protein